MVRRFLDHRVAVDTVTDIAGFEFASDPMPLVALTARGEVPSGPEYRPDFSGECDPKGGKKAVAVRLREVAHGLFLPVALDAATDETGGESGHHSAGEVRASRKYRDDRKCGSGGRASNPSADVVARKPFRIEDERKRERRRKLSLNATGMGLCLIRPRGMPRREVGEGVRPTNDGNGSGSIGGGNVAEQPSPSPNSPFSVGVLFGLWWLLREY